jgi:hypothetical protein
MLTIHGITTSSGVVGWAIIKDKTSIVKEFTDFDSAWKCLDTLEDGEAKPMALKNVKKGDYFKRKPEAKTVYIRGEYCKALKAYSCIDAEDINKELMIKGDKLVFIGFTY